MDLYNLKQYVLVQTHKQGNTLDWIISKKKFTYTIKNTRRLPARSLYYNMDPQGRETAKGKDKPHQ